MAEQPEDKEARITLPISASSALLAMALAFGGLGRIRFTWHRREQALQPPP